MFSIRFTDEPFEYPYDDATVPAAPGRLVLGASEEGFLSNLRLWRKPDYENHWHRELTALLDGRSKIALIVSYDSPSRMEIWNVYRDGELAHFQNQLLRPAVFENQLLWPDNTPHGSTAWELSQHIQDRIVKNEAGNIISEWDVAMRDIEAFVGHSV